MSVITSSWSQLIYAVILTTKATTPHVTEAYFSSFEEKHKFKISECPGEKHLGVTYSDDTGFNEILTVAKLGTNTRCFMVPED